MEPSLQSPRMCGRGRAGVVHYFTPFLHFFQKKEVFSVYNTDLIVHFVNGANGAWQVCGLHCGLDGEVAAWR